MSESISRKDKLRAILQAARFRPRLWIGVLFLSVAAALSEGIGISFILPIIELARGDVDPTEAGGILGVFADFYLALGIPFTLGYLVVGVAAIMFLRYSMSFLVAWLRGALKIYYIQHLQQEAFENAMVARTEYFDREGSDDILNAIVTQSEYAGRTLSRLVRMLEQSLLSFMYFAFAFYIAPLLTIGTAIVLGTITFAFRNVLESGYSIGDRVAKANEEIQRNAQAGTRGIRDVKLFGIRGELLQRFNSALDQFASMQVRYHRNQSAIKNFYQMSTAVSIFVLIYVALSMSAMSLGGLGVFLFAMFRLGPRVSTLNNLLYRLDADLPHLVRTQEFVNELESYSEPYGDGRSLTERVESVAFDDVSFTYGLNEGAVLNDVSFSADRGEFVAFVGPSGAGKSTIVSLLTRLYDAEDGQITANGIPIEEFEIADWRSRVSVVRQDPHIFNDTLRRNITIADRDTTQEEVERACEIAQVTEFLDSLPNQYETQLGDDGVRLSGGQRQRVAVARALLKDADILVLDEATSDLDSSLEERVHRGIEALNRDYITIVIAHRLSTVTEADRIYTLEDGAVTEVGPHDKLLDEDGMYADLYAMQTQS